VEVQFSRFPNNRRNSLDAGPRVERRGPKAAAAAAAILFSCGLILGGIGLARKSSWLVFLGMGIIGGMGCELGYISPVGTLVKWFSDRRGMATDASAETALWAGINIHSAGIAAAKSATSRSHKPVSLRSS
jgi:hypothetical protein